MMFEFDQYLGWLAFLFLITLGFWVMLFLINLVVPMWVYGALKERYQEYKEKKRLQQQEAEDIENA